MFTAVGTQSMSVPEEVVPWGGVSALSQITTEVDMQEPKCVTHTHHHYALVQEIVFFSDNQITISE